MKVEVCRTQLVLSVQNNWMASYSSPILEVAMHYLVLGGLGANGDVGGAVNIRTIGTFCTFA